MSFPELYKRKMYVGDVNLPYIDSDISDLLKNFGKMVVYDDRHDLYQFSSFRHESRLHHWYPGAFTVVLAELGGVISKMGEFMQVFSERIESRGEQDLGVILKEFINGMPEAMSDPAHQAYKNMKTGIKEERAIPLDELQRQYSEIPKVSESENKPLLKPPAPPFLKKP